MSPPDVRSADVRLRCALSLRVQATALYIFPTKALAQDQLRALKEMTAPPYPVRGPRGGEERSRIRFAGSLQPPPPPLPSIPLRPRLACPQHPPLIGVYDGDTDMSSRSTLRDCARLLITNPDMLHLSVLPQHPSFQRFLAGLRYVVIDEAHAYRGAFGSHTAMVLRRLRRICDNLYGAATGGAPPQQVDERPRLPCYAHVRLAVADPIRAWALLPPPFRSEAPVLLRVCDCDQSSRARSGAELEPLKPPFTCCALSMLARVSKQAIVRPVPRLSGSAPQELSGLPAADIALVADDGSPSAPKLFVLWNPALKARLAWADGL